MHILGRETAIAALRSARAEPFAARVSPIGVASTGPAVVRVVTGASSGIGAGLAARLASEGVRVVLAARQDVPPANEGTSRQIRSPRRAYRQMPTAAEVMRRLRDSDAYPL